MCGEEGLLTNFHKFHGDRAASTMFSQHFRKTYRTDRGKFLEYFGKKLEKVRGMLRENMENLEQILVNNFDKI